MDYRNTSNSSSVTMASILATMKTLEATMARKDEKLDLKLFCFEGGMPEFESWCIRNGVDVVNGDDRTQVVGIRNDLPGIPQWDTLRNALDVREYFGCVYVGTQKAFNLWLGLEPMPPVEVINDPLTPGSMRIARDLTS